MKKIKIKKNDVVGFSLRERGPVVAVCFQLFSVWTGSSVRDPPFQPRESNNSHAAAIALCSTLTHTASHEHTHASKSTKNICSHSDFFTCLVAFLSLPQHTPCLVFWECLCLADTICRCVCLWERKIERAREFWVFWFSLSNWICILIP